VREFDRLILPLLSQRPGHEDRGEDSGRTEHHQGADAVLLESVHASLPFVVTNRREATHRSHLPGATPG